MLNLQEIINNNYLVERDLFVIFPSNSGLEPSLSQIDFNLSTDRGNISLLRQRAEDIPYLVYVLLKKNTNVIGVTGYDLLLNYVKKTGLNPRIFYDENPNHYPSFSNPPFSYPTLCLIGCKDKELSEGSEIIVNQKYLFLAMDYLERKGISDYRFFPLSGKTENLIPILAPLGIEIVRTGRTLSFVDENKERNPSLEIKEVILQSGIVVFSYDLF